MSVPVGPSTIDSAEYRKQLSESYGFRQIGETLPKIVLLKDIIDSFPKEVFEINEMKALISVYISATSYALGLFMIAKSPWYLLPLSWAWTGTAATGLFMIGHDCGHKIFSRNKLLEVIVGTLAMLPVIYPYESWRFKHDTDHARTNMLQGDTGWHPFGENDLKSLSPFLRKALIYGYGTFRPLMSIPHWWGLHFDLSKFKSNQKKRVKISLVCVFAFMAIGWPWIIYKTGVMGWIKFWLMPWLGYHFWMSTLTMVHTAPHIPFKSPKEWNAAQAQLNGTVHCVYPRWVEILCHDVDIHIPHHVCPRIPSYNLRAAHKSLQENWGKYLNEAT